VRPVALAVALTALVAAPASGAGFQATAEGLLGARAGALVACDPTSGRLLALVHPGEAGSAYPPGSTFKLITAIAALEAGVAPGNRTFACRGVYRPQGPVPAGFSTRCWKPEGHGTLPIEGAIAQSCNVAFLQIGERTGLAALTQTAVRAGLGRLPGRLPAPGDRSALLPTSIGEGPAIAVTQLQMAGLVGAIATGKPAAVPVWRPTSGARGAAIASGETLAWVRAGMRGSVLYGSSRAARSGRVAIAGKTGTATYLDGSNRTYGWFVGYAPVERPRVAVVVFLKDANGFGGAAPLGRGLIEAWDEAGRP
jgi:penicillin-binding protein 2